ncbi:hypothetical protein TCAL_13483 [Tigriopus californicus]|uniref:Uncharacterized protein n=1 Tax=Tigriopus californicus TaxID=6832 RepID=A0A553P426_TIGCA|nr:hypothetical protein TCAL_13483 [Tigriopus californicus]
MKTNGISLSQQKQMNSPLNQSGCKRFEPWIVDAEAKKNAGLKKPRDLEEARLALAENLKWKQDAEKMKAVLDNAHAAAQKMTLHDEPDQKHEHNVKRWEVIELTANDRIEQLQAMVDVWQKQADTAAMVTAAIAANPSESSKEMKLEDLEVHLNSLRQMFIEKQKMMEKMENSDK